MKLETIKRNNNKKIIIGSMIVLSMVGCLTLTTSRAKYRNVQSLKLASGIVKIDNKYDFKIMAMYQSEDGENYNEIDTMPNSEYVINEEKSYCTIDNKTQVKGKLKTVNGIHGMYGLNKNEKCYIWFDLKLEGSGILIAKLKKSEGYKGNTTPTFTSIATGAETEANNGIYVTDDPMYGTGRKTYYWRGAATTNHVIFDNKCWRIVRINGDGSIRLIYNGAVQSGNVCIGNGANDGSVVLSGTSYNSSDSNSSYVGWTYSVGNQRPSTANPQTNGIPSTIKTALENWYSSNISTTAKNRVVAGKFCNDRRTQNNETWRPIGDEQLYAAYQRIFGDTKVPTLSCSDGDIYQLDVGMITVDEILYAGASGYTINRSYYLYNQKDYWTMTPNRWSDGSGKNARVYCLDYFGRIDSNGWVTSTSIGVRPVINLSPSTTFNSGSDGTQNNPYIVQ